MASGSSHPAAVSSEALRERLDYEIQLLASAEQVTYGRIMMPRLRELLGDLRAALAAQQSPSAPSREPCKCGFTRNGRVLPSCPFCTEQPSESPAEELRERIARILVGVANDPKYEGHGPREAALYAADLILTAIAQERA